MIITFVSCFLNHHQLPLCEELKNNCDEFYFVATEAIPESRLEMGYEDLNTAYDFVVRTYDESYDEDKFYSLLEKSDIVIFGTSPLSYIEYRMAYNKPTFIYQERYFKKGVWRRFIPHIRARINKKILKHKNKNLYVLCASGFLSSDLELMGFDANKCFKWGYFPRIDTTSGALPERNNSPVRILWAGRFLNWKHPELPIKSVAKLCEQGVDFTLDYIGIGDMEKALARKVKKYGLENKVRFLGSMSPAQVLENMEKADIFLMTSDFREGWGAVVNESMGTGCAVLASSAAGSVPFLVDDSKNGLIYDCSDENDFTSKLQKLIEDADLRKKLGENAYTTIQEKYNAKVAAKRLVEFVSSGCKYQDYEAGPMSKAPVLRNDWYKV